MRATLSWRSRCWVMEVPDERNTLRIIVPSFKAKIISAISCGSSQGAIRRASGERAISFATPSVFVFAQPVQGHDATQLCWEAIRLARALAAHATAAHQISGFHGLGH